MRICILYGGLSNEREVSIKSGKSIFNTLRNKYDAYLYDFKGNYNKLYDNIKNADIVFNALHGGDGEDGTIQLFLEKKNILFTGSDSNSSKIAMDKNATKAICKENSIPTPDWIIAEGELNLSKLKKFNYKSIVVKPSDEGSSIGLTMINEFDLDNKLKINELYKSIDKCKKISNNILVEEYIEGRELTVPVLGEEVLPAVEIKPKNIYYDYTCKYQEGKSEYIVPAILEKKNNELLYQYTKEIFIIMGCRQYARVDYRLSKNNQLYLLEVNTLPGFTSTSLFPKSAIAKNISYSNLLDSIILLAKK